MKPSSSSKQLHCLQKLLSVLSTPAPNMTQSLQTWKPWSWKLWRAKILWVTSLKMSYSIDISKILAVECTWSSCDVLYQVCAPATLHHESYFPKPPLAVGSSSATEAPGPRAPQETWPGKTPVTASFTGNGWYGCFPSITTRFMSVWRYAHPVEVFQFGRRAVTEPLHCLDWRITKIGGFSIHHLYHHDPQRPDVHLWEPTTTSIRTVQSNRSLLCCFHTDCNSPPMTNITEAVKH